MKEVNESTPEHIREYRYQSWQIEMLIAGGILYGLFTSGSLIREFFFEQYPISDVTTNKIILLFGTFVITKVLLIGFSANFFLRAVWLGYLGISFWFPNDIDYSKLRGSEEYKEALKSQPNANQRLLILEKWCNLSFSFAVLLGFLCISMFVTVSAIVWLLDKISLSYGLANSPTFIYILVLVVTLIQIGVLDIFLLRKQKTGSKKGRFKRFIVGFLNIITLSFLTRREFLVLRTNTRKWVLSAFILLYLGIAVVASASSVGDFYSSNAAFKIELFDDRSMFDVSGSPRMTRSYYSNNLNEKSKIFYGAIQSEIVTEDFLKLFIVSWVDFDLYLEDRYIEYDVKIKNPEFDTREQVDSFLQRNALNWQKSINDLLTISIDSTKQKALEWARYKHPVTNEEGYVTFIPIDSLQQAKHQLKVLAKRKFNNGYIRENVWLNIPFWVQQ